MCFFGGVHSSGKNSKLGQARCGGVVEESKACGGRSRVGEGARLCGIAAEERLLWFLESRWRGHRVVVVSAQEEKARCDARHAGVRSRVLRKAGLWGVDYAVV